MAQSAFEFDDYKAFAITTIEAMENGGRGVRRKLAEFIGCQVAYVSHVLAGERHFSQEQTEALARFFALREDETEFLFLLVERARAGTPELQRYLQNKIEERSREYLEIRKRIRITQEISLVEQAEYYSSWHYQAVRTLLTIPEFRNAQTIVKRLQLPANRVAEILSFLVSKGLAQETPEGYQPTEKQIHLPRTSPLISKLHTNWRVQTLSALDRTNLDDYHYSGLVTLSETDAKRVREVMMKALADAIAIVRPSKEEKMCVLAMDFYEL